ncbi:MAG: glycosyltransferase [Acuticoccus sp.]
MSGAAAPAPVALFVYNRPEHTIRTLEALAANTLARSTPLVIFCDQARTARERPAVDRVRRRIAAEAWRRRFGDVQIVHAPANKGLARSVTDGVGSVIARHGRVIVMEDDLISAPDFLAFANACLAYYRDDPLIGSIAGYSPLRRLPPDMAGGVYALPRNGSHGWATWADRWQKVDWTLPGYARFRGDRQSRARFDRAGADRSRRLDREMAGRANSWSIRFGFDLFERGLLTVYPRDNRIANIGGDGSGVHGARGFPFNPVLPERPRPFALLPLVEDPRIVRAAARLYGGGPARRAMRHALAPLREAGQSLGSARLPLFTR